jgi:hypothetical protein
MVNSYQDRRIVTCKTDTDCNRRTEQTDTGCNMHTEQTDTGCNRRTEPTVQFIAPEEQADNLNGECVYTCEINNLNYFTYARITV